MDFGLGLVLSITDNASSGLQNAVNSLNQLTETASNATNSLSGMAQLGAFSIVADQLGNSFMKAGTGILGVFTKLLGRVQATGMDFENFRITLNALYGDAQTAEKQISKLLDFSIKSPFEVNDVKDMLIVLKSQGIDAFEQMSNASNSFKQENLSWIADLMAFKPDIPTERWKLAITNFLGSGEAKMLRNVLDMGKIDELLGHKIGDTAEARMQDLVQIVNDANIQGLADKMSNTWQGVSSNIGDAFTKLYKSIADNGVFDRLKSSFMGVSGAIMSLDNAELEALGKTIADGINVIVTPVSVAAEKVNTLITSLVKLCQTNPGLVKTSMVVVAVAGSLLVLGGVALKFASMLGMASIGLRNFGGAFSSISGMLRAGALRISSVLLPLTAMIGIVYLAWKHDLGGLRTLLTDFISDIHSSFGTARQALEMNVTGMMNTVNDLQNVGDFWSNITVGLIKIETLWRSVCDAWGDYTLSEDLFQKCKELGILPFIEALLDFKWRLEHFWTGFKQGIDTALTDIKNFFAGFAGSLDGTIFDSVIDGGTRFLQMLTDNDPQAWTDFGSTLGELAVRALSFVTAFRGLGAVGGIASRLFGIVRPLLGLIASHPIVAIIAGVTTALVALYNNSEEFRNLVNNIFDTVGQIGGEVFSAVMPVFQDVIGFLQDALPQIIPFFVQIGESLMPIVENMLPVFEELIGSIITTVITLMPTIMEVISTVSDILTRVFDIVGQLIALVLPFIMDIASQLGGLISDILPVIADLIADVVDAVMNVVNTCLPIIQRIIEALMPIIHTIMNIISTVVSKLVPIIKSVVSIVVDVVKAITAIVVPIIKVIMKVVEGIITILSPIVNLILQGVGFIINIIMGIVQVVASVIEAIVGYISGVIQVVMSIVDFITSAIMAGYSVIVGIVSVCVETACSIIGGIIHVVQNVWDWIVSIFSNAIGFFTDIFTSVFDIIAGIFTDISDFFSTVWDGIIEIFNTIGDTISGAIKGAINTVLEGAVGIINGFIKAINFAIGVINAIPGVSITKLTELSVPALAKGGVVDSPTTALIGEAGKEAVMPLENNTGWINDLAFMISRQIESVGTNRQFTPVDNSVSNHTNSQPKDRYMSSAVTNNHNENRNIDNSVTFAEGAIQINCQNASEAEAVRMAKTIMEYIKRQKELDTMLAYG